MVAALAASSWGGRGPWAVGDGVADCGRTDRQSSGRTQDSPVRTIVGFIIYIYIYIYNVSIH